MAQQADIQECRHRRGRSFVCSPSRPERRASRRRRCIFIAMCWRCARSSADICSRRSPTTSTSAARRSASRLAWARCWFFRCASAAAQCAGRAADAGQSAGRRARFRATALFTAPTAYRSLLPLVAGSTFRACARCISAGEALPKATSDAWHAATGMRIIDGIGATEMIHIFISAKGEHIRPGMTGKPLPGYQACVLDDQDRPLPPRESRDVSR